MALAETIARITRELTPPGCQFNEGKVKVEQPVAEIPVTYIIAKHPQDSRPQFKTTLAIAETERGIQADFLKR